jgi:hypothetical protein
MAALKLPRKRDLIERLGDAPHTWAGKCHQAAVAVVELMGAENATVRRGYFDGPVPAGAYFHGRVCQHSWCELRDGRVLDPTRFAFTAEPPWPLWVGEGTDYDIGGCRAGAPFGKAPDSDFTRGSPLVTLRITSEALESTGLDFCMDPELLDAWSAQLTSPQVFWLANLPVKDQEGLGQLSRLWAPDVFRAIVAAGMRSAIPIDRLDWICPDLSEGRSSF